MNEATSPRVADRTDSFYQKHQKVYPRESSGRFTRLRQLAVVVLLGLFYLLPWLTWDQRPLLLFDLPARKFWLAGLVLWPQDFIFLTWLLVLAGLSLFFFTALAGRLWCGFACPQTVWTEVFIWLEQAVEGNRQQRMRLDQAAWSFAKFWRKALKQVLWLSFALWTGLSFVGFFVPIRELLLSVGQLSVNGWPLFWVLFYGFATYGNAGYLREQVCTYMCPYARFQSAMFDNDTLIITYDPKRGEPRGKRQRGTDLQQRQLGSCVDCTLCVQVCPTGIDIRNGLQYQCIGCAACIDACDSVMTRMDYPTGLIRYTTQHAIDGQATHVIRPRMVVYAVLLSGLLMAGLIALFLRQPIGLDVIRDRNALYREVRGDTIENVYNVKILNKDPKPRELSLRIMGLPALSLADHTDPIRVGGGEVLQLPIRVDVPADSLHGSHTVRFILTDKLDATRSVQVTAKFFAP
jgi:cytochrome c oxidase accessory protein FixG